VKLALTHLLSDISRLVVAVVGVGFAVVLMIFQGSLLLGFMSAASRVMSACDADLWIVPKGVSSVDFPAPLPERFADLSMTVDGVEHVDRLCFGFVSYRRPDGTFYSLGLVGVEGVRNHTRFPFPSTPGASISLPETLTIDESTARILDIRSLPERGELLNRRVQLSSVVSGFSTFLGAPYGFLHYRDAQRYLHLSPDETHFLLVRIRRGADIDDVRRRLAARLPEVIVWTNATFSKRAEVFWMTQTGAGGAILAAAVLGFLIGMMITSQTLYSTTMERIEEIATLKALGATSCWLIKFILTQTLAIGAAGSLIGALLAPLAVSSARIHVVPWVDTPAWLPIFVTAPTLIMCSAAAFASIRTVLHLEPANVFRA